MTDEHSNGSKNTSSISTTSIVVNTNVNSNADTSVNANSNNNNSATNNNNSSSSNEHLIAEAAAKFLLKNGLNGTNAAAAATLLSAAAAAATFQLPATPARFQTAKTAIATTEPIVTRLEATASTVSPTTLLSTSSTSKALGASNGFLPHASAPQTTETAKSMASTTTALVATAPKPADVLGVLDYSTLNNVASAAPTPPSSMTTVKSSSKFTSNSGTSAGCGSGSSNTSGSNNNSFDMGRPPISTTNTNSMAGYGGRLQFFKDGKFILELARSKDGEKGGWVSVPRKTFRPPSAATSATVTPTSAVATTYPKNENSTSLSFSDDNSSIQSSPWQRDQPWKQSRPRRGISKELSLYYQRPRHAVLTKCGLRAAFRKRRRPFEQLTTPTEQHSIFERVESKRRDTLNGDETLKADAVEVKTPEQHLEIKDIKQEALQKAMPDAKKSVHEGSQPKSPAQLTTVKQEVEEQKAETEKEPKHAPPTCVEKMNTSEDEDAMSVPVEESTITSATPVETANILNGNACEQQMNGVLKAADAETSNEAIACKSERNEKRLNKQKPRAKLNSIIQKLIDSAPARLEQLSKTLVSGTMSGSGGGAINSTLSHSLGHKVSPPSSSAANRLVEYHHQHVSPRKRILRELEKVSLDDSCVNNGGAGGKRSRAKSGGSSSNSIQSASTKSSPSRCNATSINLAPPQAKISGNSIVNNHATTTTIATTTSSASSASASSAQPTRLNSSYSIHSLLGGNNGSSSSSNKSNDQPATIINVHHPALYRNYPRVLHTSPKSPEVAGNNGGGKSPSHASSKKRSPPYATGSPLQEAHTHTRVDYGRRTPPENYKQPLAAHHHHHPQLQHSFYAPYGMAPQYGASGSAAAQAVTACATRLQPGNVGACSSPHIPHALAAREMSPPRSSTASPREPSTTPRTVPKKTASIRREFASPTASSSSSSNTPNNNSSCSSPGERSSNASPERRHAPPPHMHLQRSSPSSSAAAAAAAAAVAVNSQLHYCLHPPVVSPYHSYISTLATLRPPFWMQHYQTGASSHLPPHPHASGAASSGAVSRLSSPSPFHPFAYNGLISQPPATGNPHLTHAHSAHGLPHHTPHLGALTGSNNSGGGVGSAERRSHTPKQMTDSSSDQIGVASASHRTSSPAINNASSGFVGSSSTSTSSATPHGYAPSITTMSNGGSSVQSAMFQSSSLRNEPSSDLPLNLSKH